MVWQLATDLSRLARSHSKCDLLTQAIVFWEIHSLYICLEFVLGVDTNRFRPAYCVWHTYRRLHKYHKRKRWFVQNLALYIKTGIYLNRNPYLRILISCVLPQQANLYISTSWFGEVRLIGICVDICLNQWHQYWQLLTHSNFSVFSEQLGLNCRSSHNSYVLPQFRLLD